MRAGAIFFALWCLLAPLVWPATERSPHEWYDAIKALRIDPANVYRVAPTHHIQLRRGDAVLSFEEGTLAFFSPLDGQISGAVFFSARQFSIRILLAPTSASRTTPSTNFCVNSVRPLCRLRWMLPSRDSGNPP